MKNGLYVDDGAHDVRVTRCRLFECEKFGVFVGDNASHVVLDDCVLSGNLKGGLIVSEGGVAEVMGLQTAVCDNALRRLASTAMRSKMHGTTIIQR